MRRWEILIGGLFCVILLVTGCGSSFDYTVINESAVSRDGQETTWDSLLNHGDVDDVINAELDYINGDKENPWLNGDMLRLVTEYDVIELLLKSENEDAISNIKGPYIRNVRDEDGLKDVHKYDLIDSYKDYDFYTYEEIEENILGLEEDIIKPLGFVHELSKVSTNKNMNIMLDDWDETKHYLLGIACGLKVRKEWNSSIQDNVQYGDIIVKTFSAEELAEFLPANIDFEEQARYVFNNVYFHSGIKVSCDLFRLYQYIYNACDFEFMYEIDKEEVVESNISEVSDIKEDLDEEVKKYEIVTDFSYWEENNYSFVINNIDKETRQVYIKFVKGTKIDDGRVEE